MPGEDRVSCAPYTFSWSRNRLVGDGLELVERIKPGVRRRLLRCLLRPRHLRVERYRTGHDDNAVKYAPGRNARLDCEIDNVTRLAAVGAPRSAGLLWGDSIRVTSCVSAGRGVLTPWMSGGNLKQVLQAEPVDPGRLLDLFRDAGKILRTLHDLPVDVLPANSGPSPRAYAQALLQPHCGHEIDQCVAQPALASVPVERLLDELGSARRIVHGDCFPYQFLIDSSRRIVLSDWETARVDYTGYCDVAQFLGVMQIALTLNESLHALIDNARTHFQEGYAEDLENSVLAKVMEIQALIRFSPRCALFKLLIPMLPGSERAGHQVRYDTLLRERVDALRERMAS